MTSRLEASASNREGVVERVFHGSTLSMAVCAPEDGSILEVNESFCYLVGRGIGDLLGTSVFELGLFDALGVAQAVQQLRDRGVLEGFDASFVTPAGETRVVRFWAETVNGGDPLVVVAPNHKEYQNTVTD